MSGQGVCQHLSSLGEVFLELYHYPVHLGVDLLRRELLVDGVHHGGHAGLASFGHSGQQVAHEVGATALPTGSGECRGDGVLQTLVSI